MESPGQTESEWAVWCQWAGLVARLHRGLLPGPFSSIIFVSRAVLYDALYDSLPFLWYFPPFWYCLLQILELTNSKLLANFTGVETCCLAMYWLMYIITCAMMGSYASGELL